MGGLIDGATSSPQSNSKTVQHIQICRTTQRHNLGSRYFSASAALSIVDQGHGCALFAGFIGHGFFYVLASLFFPWQNLRFRHITVHGVYF